MSHDYYGLLGVRQNTPSDEIKKSYRRLARELHPDINPDPLDQERFKDITTAYDVLSDPHKREMYNLGLDPFKGGNKPAGFKFSDAFQRATAEKSDVEKLHFATERHLADEAMALLGAGVVPAEKTLWFILLQRPRRMPDWMKKVIAAGEPTPDMLHFATVNQMAEEAGALREAGVVPAEKTMWLILRQCQKIIPDWKKKLLTAGEPTAAMLDFAAHKDMMEAAEALVAGGAVAARETLTYLLNKRGGLLRKRRGRSLPMTKLIAPTVKVTPDEILRMRHYW
jgi:hypothetical protein